MTHVTRTIPQRELRNSVSQVLKEVAAGATVRVTVAGRPVADLVPIVERRHFVSRDIVMRILRETPLDTGFEADVAGAIDDRVPE